MEEQTEQPKFAVLIDGDNAQSSLLTQILAEVSKTGLITIKRIYGDWTTTHMNQWKESLHKHAIQPMQQFRYTVGKNATDSAMIIDAMDLLHSNDLQGFCIVSSDSDYTRLATRIREDGLFVIGVGEKKTPEAFPYCGLRKPKGQEDTKPDQACPFPAVELEAIVMKPAPYVSEHDFSQLAITHHETSAAKARITAAVEPRESQA